MRDDLQYPARSTQVRRSAAARVTLLALGLALPGASALAANPDDSGSFLLIDGGAPVGQPRLTGCDRAIDDLHASLDKAGARNTVLIAPTAGGLREALLRFGNGNEGKPNAVLFCGYAMEAGGNVFALGSDFASHDDPALSAVSVRAFSRMTEGKNGLVMLDLHPMAVDGASLAAVAGALDGAAGAWSADTSLSGTRIVATDRQPGDATLIDKAARSGAGTPGALAQLAGRPAAQPITTPPVTQPGTPPAQATPARTPATIAAAPAPKPSPSKPDAVKTPTVQPADGKASAAAAPAAPSTSGSGTEPTVATPAGAAPASGGAGGTIALAPKPAGDAAPPRKRVHVDPAVRRVQVALLARGLFNGRVNGVDSEDTQSGIKHFQAMLGHPATGQLSADELKQLTGG